MNTTRVPAMLLTLTAMIGSTVVHADTMVCFENDGGGDDPRGLYDFDTDTGVSTFRAPIGAGPQFTALARRSSDGTVFGVDAGSSTIYTLDLDDGTFTLVAATGLDTIAAITFDSTGLFYGLARHGLLFEIDLTDGSSTLIGDAAPVGAALVTGPGGVLYGFARGTRDLHTIDPIDGSPTLIGGSGAGAGTLEDAAFTPSGAIILTDFEGCIFDVDPATGARTLLGSTGLEFGLFGIVHAVDGACPEDIDGSGAVDFGDILAILSAWGNAGGPEDLDGSGTVDFGDVLIVLGSWGGCG